MTRKEYRLIRAIEIRQNQIDNLERLKEKASREIMLLRGQMVELSEQIQRKENQP